VFGARYYRDWDGVLEGLEEPITGLGWCIKGFVGAYYRDCDGVLKGL
jgi:hypothetical protein